MRRTQRSPLVAPFLLTLFAFASVLIAAPLAGPAAAQSFGIVVKVNDDIITKAACGHIIALTAIDDVVACAAI